MPAQLTELSPDAHKVSLDGTYLGHVRRLEFGIWAMEKRPREFNGVFLTAEDAADQMAVDYRNRRANLRRV